MISIRQLLIGGVGVLICCASSRAEENLLVNDGFESPSIAASAESDTNPSDWTVFSSVNGGEKIGLSSANARSGKQSARMTAQGVVESYQGIFQASSASPGKSYAFSV